MMFELLGAVTMTRQRDDRSPFPWQPVLAHALPVLLFVLALFYYWFAVANRYVVFLYEHLDATPFDSATTSRYWMAGLVAAGMVMILYSAVNWLLGRVSVFRGGSYDPRAWWQVWLFSLVPLIVGIPFMTMNFNWPTLPFSVALTVTAATLIGLAFALVPGRWAARRPSWLGWLVLDGMGLVPVLLLLHAIELPDRDLISQSVAYVAALGSVVAGVFWLTVVSVLRAWRRRPTPGAGAVLEAGLCLSYLLLPVVHYFFAAFPYRYITVSSNYFAFSPGVQLLVLLVAAALATAVTQLRRRWLATTAHRA